MPSGAPANKALRWPAEAVWEAVAPLLPGFSVEILPILPSTNTALMERARAGRVEPIVLVAEQQSAGRGRMGRQWLSEVQGTGPLPLTFSIGLPLAPRDWSGLSLAVGLAVAQSLHADIQLKWPNDLWLRERKLGGILIETASMGALRYAVIGIGLNIGPRATEGLRTPPAWLRELRPEADAAHAFGLIAPAVVKAVLEFADQGLVPLHDAYQERDALHGRQVLCSDGRSGVARGVDAQGALLLQTAQGLQKISSAEVSVRPSGGAPPAA
jgi:BirA family biotin operon repressor/biotin-[acetyl-CoA-carboxylase] ligase